MTIRTLLIAGIAITSAIPASAQDMAAPATNGAAASHSEGIRIAEASNGFQLVEHGLWRSAQTAPAPRLAGPLVDREKRFARAVERPREKGQMCA